MTEHDEPDEGAEVVPLRRTDQRDKNARDAQLDELLVRQPSGFTRDRACDHRYSEVDTSARTLKCRKCGVDLDPITVIGQLANEAERIVQEAQRWRREADEMRERVDVLRREEANCKSRIRTARRRRGDDGAADAAARAFHTGALVRDWDGLHESYRAEWLRRFRPAIEAYLAHDDQQQVEVA